MNFRAADGLAGVMGDKMVARNQEQRTKNFSNHVRRGGGLAAWEFFHTMEKVSAIFPHNGKTLSIFSTLWKIVFHSVEKS